MSVEDFERGMDLLAHAEGTTQGRWIVTPQKGVPFLGHRDRARMRARERRRRVFVFLLESIVLTALIGLVPPLRVMWTASAVMLGLLVLYVWLLLSIKARARRSQPQDSARAARAPEQPGPATEPAVPQRYVADGESRTPRPSFHGLGGFQDDEDVHVVVMPASEVLSAARA